ncbi:MAG: endonuclease IV, partial [Propionibacteriales bacterium]|nr:endonuclease IV [Propionibacteriales bacterium]
MRNPVGSHVFVGSGLVSGALRTAATIEAEAIQVFVGNPRGWAPSAGDPAIDEAFGTTCTDRGLRSFVHTPYLVNLGSPT